MREFPDYRKFVARPMDLGTITSRLAKGGHYTSPKQASCGPREGCGARAAKGSALRCSALRDSPAETYWECVGCLCVRASPCRLVLSLASGV